MNASCNVILPRLGALGNPGRPHVSHFWKWHVDDFGRDLILVAMRRTTEKTDANGPFRHGTDMAAPSPVTRGTGFGLECDIVSLPLGPHKWAQMTRREFILSLVGGITCGPFADLRGLAQAVFPAEGSKLTFTLTATDGTAVTDQTYRGKWLIIYFGYTYCPDVCPTTMMEIAGALNALGPHADMVQALFITVDPQRDTAAVLNDYLKSFDPRLVGLTGTHAQIAAAAKAFHVFYERNDTDGVNYLYDHSSDIYLVNPDGSFARAINSRGSSRAISDALSALIAAR
jgi:protein SCO1/2